MSWYIHCPNLFNGYCVFSAVKGKSTTYCLLVASVAANGFLGYTLWNSDIEHSLLEQRVTERKVEHRKEIDSLKDSVDQITEKSLVIAAQFEELKGINSELEKKIEFQAKRVNFQSSKMSQYQDELVRAKNILINQHAKEVSLDQQLDAIKSEFKKLGSMYKETALELGKIRSDEIRDVAKLQALTDDVFVWKSYHQATMQDYSGRVMPILEDSLIIISNYETRLKGVKRKYEIDIPDLKKRGKDHLVEELKADFLTIDRELKVCYQLKARISDEMQAFSKYLPEKDHTGNGFPIKKTNE